MKRKIYENFYINSKKKKKKKKKLHYEFRRTKRPLTLPIHR